MAKQTPDQTKTDYCTKIVTTLTPNPISNANPNFIPNRNPNPNTNLIIIKILTLNVTLPCC